MHLLPKKHCFFTQRSTLLAKSLPKSKSRQILISRQKNVLRPKIFVWVQTVQRRPFVPMRNSCHPESNINKKKSLTKKEIRMSQCHFHMNHVHIHASILMIRSIWDNNISWPNVVLPHRACLPLLESVRPLHEYGERKVEPQVWNGLWCGGRLCNSIY